MHPELIQISVAGKEVLESVSRGIEREAPKEPNPTAAQGQEPAVTLAVCDCSEKK